MCLTLRGNIGSYFFGITGLSSSELIASDWLNEVDGYTWPGLSSAGAAVDATPDYITHALPVSGGYVYTRQSADGTEVDLIGPGGVIYNWSSSSTGSYALAVDPSGDYWLVVALDDGSASADNSLWRVTPAGTATKVIVAVDADNGVSPQQVTTTPDGAVWFSKYGLGEGLWRWHSGTATAVSGVGVVTTLPRPDSSVWYSEIGWGSITPSLVVTTTSPCADLDTISSWTAAWIDDWSTVAIHDSATGDVYEIDAAEGGWTVGRIAWGSRGAWR